MEKACQVLQVFMKQSMFPKIELAWELAEENTTHSDLYNQVSKFFLHPKVDSKLQEKYKIKGEECKITHANFQSGTKCVLNFDSNANDAKLVQNVTCAVLSASLDVEDVKCYCSRTLFLNSAKEMVNCYNIILTAYKQALGKCREGIRVKDIYRNIYNSLNQSHYNIMEFVGKNFGFKISSDADNITIDENCNHVIKSAEYYAIGIGLENVVLYSQAPFSLWILDTIQIVSGEQSPKVLTKNVPMDYEFVSYLLDSEQHENVDKTSENTTPEIKYDDSSQTSQQSVNQETRDKFSPGKDRKAKDSSGKDSRDKDASGEDRREKYSSGKDRRDKESSGRDRKDKDLSGKDRKDKHSSDNDRKDKDLSGKDRKDKDSSDNNRKDKDSSGDNRRDKNREKIDGKVDSITSNKKQSKTEESNDSESSSSGSESSSGDEKKQPDVVEDNAAATDNIGSRIRKRTIERETEKNIVANKFIAKQRLIRENKIAELKERFSSEDKVQAALQREKQLQAKKLNTYRCYTSPENFPAGIDPNRVYVDSKAECLLVPYQNIMIPFHVSTLKNVSCTEDERKKHFMLRLNFQTPGQGIVSENSIFPELKHRNSLYVKELTLKSEDGNHLQQVVRNLKELIKRVKQEQTEFLENQDITAQEKLRPNNTGKRIILKDVLIRPNFLGTRRIFGVLEAHENGFRYTINTKMQRSHIDVIYSNISHAVFQPCINSLIVSIHLHLKFPVLVGKSKTHDVQFFSESGYQTDDVDNRRARSLHDPDEIQDEQREREMRKRLNTEFKRFVTAVEEKTKLEFLIPHKDLMFQGVPSTSKVNVDIFPTSQSVVHLHEWPPFVLLLDSIEIVCFERVMHGLRNFDMIFIFKDYTKPVKRIDYIPIDAIDMIKEWLNEMEITWYEGKGSLNWTNILKNCREDLPAFAEEGGFNAFLNEESSVSGAGSEREEENEDSSEYRDSAESDESGESSNSSESLVEESQSGSSSSDSSGSESKSDDESDT